MPCASHLLALSLLTTSACSGEDTSAGGTGKIDGTLDGRAYARVAAAYVIGQPDDPDRTVVVYLLDNPIACGELAAPGWDERVTDGTQSLELKLIGQAPGQYPVPADGRPSSGESTDNYTLTSTAGAPAEVSANAGAVTLDSYEADASAVGSFDLTFGDGSLSGTFSATWCADGHEP
jgi:hypothetical protein